MSANSPLQTEKKLTAFLHGLSEAMANGKPFLYRGSALDEPSIRAIVEAELANYLDVHALEVALSVAIAKRRANQPASKQVLRDLEAGAQTTYGDESKEFLALGFTPPKKTAKRPVSTLSLQVERLRATRRARGTMGVRQREAIHGEVPPPPEVP